MRFMIKNTAGKHDAVLTMSVASLVVILFKVLVSGLSISVHGVTVMTFGTIDSGIIASILTPTLGAYVARRYTEKKFKSDTPDEKGG
jgi:hypothetical protein